ncbi:MAG: L-threonylcarbamoyladenylate synthase, partial [Methanoregula sp.]|nr:L-threonylcarbamoyladenylate synthase [Methanoregula sp.]
IFQIKGRARTKALPLLVLSLAMAQKYFIVTPLAKQLAKKYWPGSLTLVLDYNEAGKRIFKKTINKNSFDAGVRVSGNYFATALVKKLGAPLVSTSANLAGKPAALSAPEVFNYFKNKKYQPDIIVDGGTLKASKGSTVVDVRDGKVKIVRQGDISF